MKVSSLLTTTLLVLTGAGNCLSQTADYCAVSSCEHPLEHTLCKFQADTWGEACTDVDKSASVMSVETREAIVNLHNDLRRKVAKGEENLGAPGPQPSASNMRKLAWDDELAMIAQTHAQQCLFKHSNCSNVDRFSVGENVAIKGSSEPMSGPIWEDVIMGWYNEVADMPADFVSDPVGNAYRLKKETGWDKTIGHYTQVVWATTTFVGCGSSTFNDGQWYRTISVCNYGEAGIWYGSPAYEVESASSACPEGTSDDDGLCA